MDEPELNENDLEFEERKQPSQWFASAEGLKRAAELLFEHIEAKHDDGEPVNLEDQFLKLDGPAMLLLGYALETSMKGYLLKKGIVKWDDFAAKVKTSLAKKLKSHDLAAIYELTGRSLSAEQVWLLTHLTAFTSWAGRYPLPLRQDKFILDAQFSSFGNAAKLPPGSFGLQDRAQIYAIMDELYRVAESGAEIPIGKLP